MSGVISVGAAVVATAFAVDAVATAAVTAVTLTTVLSVVGAAGAILGAVGTLTHDKTLATIGGIVGAVGTIGAIANSAGLFSSAVTESGLAGGGELGLAGAGNTAGIPTTGAVATADTATPLATAGINDVSSNLQTVTVNQIGEAVGQQGGGDFLDFGSTPTESASPPDVAQASPNAAQGAPPIKGAASPEVNSATTPDVGTAKPATSPDYVQPPGAPPQAPPAPAVPEPAAPQNPDVSQLQLQRLGVPNAFGEGGGEGASSAATGSAIAYAPDAGGSVTGAGSAGMSGGGGLVNSSNLADWMAQGANAGMTPASGGLWSTFKDIMSNPFASGLISAGGKFFAGAFDPKNALVESQQKAIAAQAQANAAQAQLYQEQAALLRRQNANASAPLPVARNPGVTVTPPTGLINYVTGTV